MFRKFLLFISILPIPCHYALNAAEKSPFFSEQAPLCFCARQIFDGAKKRAMRSFSRIRASCGNNLSSDQLTLQTSGSIVDRYLKQSLRAAWIRKPASVAFSGFAMHLFSKIDNLLRM
jgi:hypothetical protein